MKNSGTNKRKITRKSNVDDNKKNVIIKYFTRVNITYFVFFLVDIILVIYLARCNKVNYVLMFDEEIFVSKTKYLLWGRNYINVIVTAFFYIYGCLINKFYLKRKNTRNFLFLLLGVLLAVNVLLFIIFTKRIY